MLDFETLNRALETAVGVGPEALLGTASPVWSNRFFLARERLAELCDAPRVSEGENLERDRLASFFGCAYGDHGFLARAGALQTLVRGLDRLANARPEVVGNLEVLSQLKRDAVLLSMLGQHRLSRPLHDDDRPLLGKLSSLAEAVGELEGFARQVQLGSSSLRVARRAQALYGAGELTALMAEMREGLPLAAAISFALGRIADWSFTRDARQYLDALCRERADALRSTLWRTANENLSHRSRPPTLGEMERLDAGLEALSAALGSEWFSAEARVQVMLTLLFLVATSLAASASRLALTRLDGTLLLLAEGLAREGRP